MSEAIAHLRPRWSPDGRKLVFQNVERTKFDVRVADVASRSLSCVTNDAAQDMAPIWSPSGRFLYFSFSSYRSGGLNVWRVPVSPSGRPVGRLTLAARSALPRNSSPRRARTAGGPGRGTAGPSPSTPKPLLLARRRVDRLPVRRRRAARGLGDPRGRKRRQAVDAGRGHGPLPPMDEGRRRRRLRLPGRRKAERSQGRPGRRRARAAARGRGRRPPVLLPGLLADPGRGRTQGDVGVPPALGDAGEGLRV